LPGVEWLEVALWGIDVLPRRHAQRLPFLPQPVSKRLQPAANFASFLHGFHAMPRSGPPHTP